MTHRNSPPPRFVPKPPPGAGNDGMRRRSAAPMRPPPGPPPRGLLRAAPGSHFADTGNGGESGIAVGIRRALGEAKLKLLASKLKLMAGAAGIRSRLGARK